MQFEQGLDALHGPSIFVDMLRYRAALQRDERAFTFLLDGEHEQVHLTYGELDCRALRVAAAPTGGLTIGSVLDQMAPLLERLTPGAGAG